MLLRFLWVCALFCKTVVAGEERFVYNNKNKRDPFYPILSTTGEFLPNPELPRIDVKVFVLEGILWDEKGDSIAVINGTLLHKREKIADYEVIDIQENSVSLFREGERMLLTLPIEQQEEGKQ